MNILTVNLLFSTLVFWIAARLYPLPKLHELEPRMVLLPILLLHAFRHLGLMFLAPGAVYAGIPRALGAPSLSLPRKRIGRERRWSVSSIAGRCPNVR